MTPLFLLAYKFSFGFKIFIVKEGIPRPMPQFVISQVYDFPYDARKVMALTILALKTPNPQILLRHPPMEVCNFADIPLGSLLNAGESFNSFCFGCGKSILSHPSGVLGVSLSWEGPGLYWVRW
jgi:hypothetical protein